MVPMSDTLAQQDYIREAKRMWRAGDTPTAILHRTGISVLSVDGSPCGLVRDIPRP